MRKLLIFTIFIVIVKVIFAQDYDTKYNTRTILITTQDSVIKARILNTSNDFKIDNSLIYYWYSDDNIGSNRGGVNGSALHGTYTVYDANNRLMTRGEFENGLKVGEWKYWYPNGELKKLENYKKGLKDGEQKYYDEYGEVINELKFKKGTELQNKENSFIKSIFKRKEEEQLVNDSIDSREKEVKKSKEEEIID